MKISKSKLEIAMANKCFSVNCLARQTGIRQETIARIKKGVQDARPSTVGKIAKVLEINVEELIESEAATSNQYQEDSERR